jgi:LuxR family transcriptional regulator, quorum-sensing system regulator SdiA
MSIRPLTDKQVEALVLVRQGERLDRAAHILDITVSAMKVRLHAARINLEAKTTTHAVARAITQGIIQ